MLKASAAAVGLATLAAFMGVGHAGPHSMEVPYYLHCDIDPAAPTGGFDFYLNAANSDDLVSPCGGDSNAGPDATIKTTWPLRDAPSFVLDGREATAQLTLRGIFGNSTLSVALVGTVAGAEKKLGSSPAEDIGGPGGTFDLSIPIKKSLQGTRISGLTLVTTITGTAQSVSFEVDSPASFITIPIRHGK